MLESDAGVVSHEEKQAQYAHVCESHTSLEKTVLQCIVSSKCNECLGFRDSESALSSHLKLTDPLSSHLKLSDPPLIMFACLCLAVRSCL